MAAFFESLRRLLAPAPAKRTPPPQMMRTSPPPPPTDNTLRHKRGSDEHTRAVKRVMDYFYANLYDPEADLPALFRIGIKNDRPVTQHQLDQLEQFFAAHELPLAPREMAEAPERPSTPPAR